MGIPDTCVTLHRSRNDFVEETATSMSCFFHAEAPACGMGRLRIPKRILTAEFTENTRQKSRRAGRENIVSATRLYARLQRAGAGEFTNDIFSCRRLPVAWAGTMTIRKPPHSTNSPLPARLRQQAVTNYLPPPPHSLRSIP